jgi:prepilin-type processing-associated H-X9-DG protein
VDTNSWVTGWLDWGSGTPNGANTNIQYLTDAALGPYMAKSIGSYKCAADTVRSAIGPRVRSYAMNEWVGDRYNHLISRKAPYRVFFKLSEFTRPGPAMTWVFLDECPDSINDGYFTVFMHTTSWDDIPASTHNGACGFSFVDGHAEIHKWLDSPTKVPVRRINPCPSSGTVSPRDSAWLRARSTVPK